MLVSLCPFLFSPSSFHPTPALCHPSVPMPSSTNANKKPAKPKACTQKAEKIVGQRCRRQCPCAKRKPEEADLSEQEDKDDFGSDNRPLKKHKKATKIVEDEDLERDGLTIIDDESSEGSENEDNEKQSAGEGDAEDGMDSEEELGVPIFT